MIVHRACQQFSEASCITRGMQSIVGRAELAIAVQPHLRAAELSGHLHIVLLYEVGNGRQPQYAASRPQTIHCISRGYPG